MCAKARGTLLYAFFHQRYNVCATPQDLRLDSCLRWPLFFLGWIRRDVRQFVHRGDLALHIRTACRTSLPSFFFQASFLRSHVLLCADHRARKRLSLKTMMSSRRWRQGSVWIQSPKMIEHDLRFHFAFWRRRNPECRCYCDIVVAMWRQESVRVQSPNMI